MKRVFSLLAVALLAGACATAQGTSGSVSGSGGASRGGDQPNILVLGEDADPDSVPRSNRVFKRVLGALANELNDQGFNVYDETAVTAGYAAGRSRRSSAEIIDIARSVKRPPIDVAVIFTIHANAERLRHTTKIRTRITGRLLNVHSGGRLGNFEVELPRPDNAPVKCNRECVLETVGGNARALGMDLGAVLAKKLDWLSPSGRSKAVAGDSKAGMSTAYTIVFSGFTPEDITVIEKYIVTFKGYEHHRPVSQSLRTNEYWYETSSDAKAQLDALGQALGSPKLKGKLVEIAGHTDATGPAAYNKALSLRRAEAVMAYLKSRYGIKPARLSVAGHGEARLKDPLAPGSGVNRRVEISVVGSLPVDKAAAKPLPEPEQKSIDGIRVYGADGKENKTIK